MRNMRKIGCMIVVILMIMIVTTISQAIIVVQENAKDVIVDGYFFPNTSIGPGTWYCIQPGGSFSPSSLMTQAEYDEEKYQPGKYIPKDGSYKCVECEPIKLPWGKRIYYKFTEGEKISFTENPDAAYVLAEMQERGQLMSWDAAYGIWNSKISTPKRAGAYDIIEESKAYDTFYQEIHGGYTSNDLFETLIKDNSGEIDIGVHQEGGYYVIGPFNIDYPDGVYRGENKFSWIESIEVLTNAGTLPVEILLKSNQKIDIAALNEKGRQSLDEKEFYVKFYSTEATQGTLKIQFGYLEHCEAEMTKYEGQLYYRKFQKETSNEMCKEHGFYDSDLDWDENLQPKIRYVIKDEAGSAVQRLMALSGTARKVRKSVVKYFDWNSPNNPPGNPPPGNPPPGNPPPENPPTTWEEEIQIPSVDRPQSIPGDLTMMLAGNVFLDQDTGKVNEGNNKLDSNEGLAGIEVTLCDANGNPVNVNYKIRHEHTGDPKLGTGCYTTPVYHKHLGDENTYGACYTKSTHTHTGSKTYGTGCYSIVYHKHTDNCYDLSTVKRHGEHQNWCYSTIRYRIEGHNTLRKLIWNEKEGKYISERGTRVSKEDAKKGYFIESDDVCYIADAIGEVICGKTENDIESGSYSCGKTEESPEGFTTSCGQEVKYTKTCEKDEKTIDYYAPSCGKTVESVEQEIVQGSTTLTDSNGHYTFKYLNAQKKYYIKFVYNGVLYTNVPRLLGNAVNISKSTEEAQGHEGNRQNFNNKFKEIGSNPSNYMSPSRGEYNQVFLQEAIVDTFKTIANNHGAHGNTDQEVFAYDCRIQAFSTERYPLIQVFTIDSFNNVIAGANYNAIYQEGGAFDQLHINLGIKARPTFDLALYKDVMKATLNINGQTEVYTYDARKDWENKGFSYGVREDYYLNELRNKYMKNKQTNIKTTETIDEGQYSHEYRTEEIINGNNVHEAYQNGFLGKDEYKVTMYGDESNKNYAWRDINSALNDAERLQIHVTYKIAIRNQSDVVGSVTEIVDYFDENYQFESAYMGDKNGNEIAGTQVEASQTSMYGEQTRMGANGQWTVGEGKRGYKTIYLRPTEKVLYGDDKEQYIYITFGLINPEETLIKAGLPDGKTFYTYNLAEINGYRTYVTNAEYKENLQYYQTHKQELASKTLGLIDRDSNPGNFNPATYTMGVTPLEDDTSKAPAYAYNIRTSRTLEGTVFEDTNTGTATNEAHVVDVAKTRFGNGTIDDKDKSIAGVKVELVEIKNGKLDVRSTTYTDKNGWYGFGAFVPGDYTIRFTYGADDQTALTKNSQYIGEYQTEYNQNFARDNGKTYEQRYGLAYGIINDTSYNGQDYQSTEFKTTNGQIASPHNYKVDATLNNMYTANNNAKNAEEQSLTVSDQMITKYEAEDYYWFADGTMAGRSDAADDSARRTQVTAYAKGEYQGREIVNHKAEVFNAYINQKTLRDQESKARNFNEFTQAQPMDETVDIKDKNRSLVNELERRNYMYAYTPEINVEIENTKKQIEGNQNATKAANDPKDYYEYKIRGVDFGVVERPRSGLSIDQDVAHVKVIATDGRTLLELNNNNGKIEVVVDNGNNYQWIKQGRTNQYDRDELINVILDDELLSGAKLEVTYNITVTNNSEQDANTTTRAKTIINYVANNLNFDLADNNGLWEAVKKEEIQTTSHSSFINNEEGKNKTKLVDLSTQTTVLKATTSNPLTKNLKPGESTTSTLTLKKTLSAESSADDLSYSNLSEITEIDSTVGRYDHGSIPGNQSIEEQPREHDTSGASRYDEIDEHAGTTDVKTRYPQDGTIIITPPTGETKVYYVLGIIVGAILLVGIALIRKLVVGKNNNKQD